MLTTKKANKARFTAPTTREVEDVFAELIRVGDLQTYHAGLLALDCGLRCGEIAQLRGPDLDFERGIIPVYAQTSSWRRRFVYMTDRVRRALREQYPMAGTSAHAFLPHHDRAAAVRKLEASLRKTASRLNVKVSFGLLRRKCVIDMANAGASMCQLTQAFGLACRHRDDCLLASCRSWRTAGPLAQHGLQPTVHSDTRLGPRSGRCEGGARSQGAAQMESEEIK